MSDTGIKEGLHCGHPTHPITLGECQAVHARVGHAAEEEQIRLAVEAALDEQVKQEEVRRAAQARRHAPAGHSRPWSGHLGIYDQVTALIHAETAKHFNQSVRRAAAPAAQGRDGYSGSGKGWGVPQPAAASWIDSSARARPAGT